MRRSCSVVSAIRNSRTRSRKQWLAERRPLAETAARGHQRCHAQYSAVPACGRRGQGYWHAVTSQAGQGRASRAGLPAEAVRQCGKQKATCRVSACGFFTAVQTVLTDATQGEAVDRLNARPIADLTTPCIISICSVPGSSLAHPGAQPCCPTYVTGQAVRARPGDQVI